MEWFGRDRARLSRLLKRAVMAAAGTAILLAAAGVALAQTRVGSTLYPQPTDGGTRRFPAVAYDSASNAYLVVWGIGDIRARSAVPIGARFVSADGTPLGSTVAVNTSGISPQVDGVRVACGRSACLVAWIEEPSNVVGRLVRYSGGEVQFVAEPFVINANRLPKLSSAAPGVAYASASDEFLVAWTEFTGNPGGPDIKAQRVSPSGSPAGAEIPVAVEALYEGFPSLTYNSAQNEYLVVYYWESGSSSNVGAQRIQPGSGALLGGRNTIYGSLFDQYPEITYNSQQNIYFAITWGFASSASWMLHGQLADGNTQPFSTPVLSLAAGGGGNGIGVAYNPVSDTYFCVYLNQNRSNTQDGNEIWGVVVNASGVPGSQFQVTFSGTKLATQPAVAVNPTSARWLTVASENYAQVMGQLVEPGANPPSPPSGGCPGAAPASGWTCDPATGNWLPPSGGSTSSCSTVQPAPDWTCVNGNWIPPGTSSGGGTSGCSTVQPASNWTCVNGNWLPPGTSSGGGTSSCSTVQPASNWTCVNGNWLPPGTSSGGGTTSSCSTVQPASNWTCVNGNWLPPGTSSGGGTSELLDHPTRLQLDLRERQLAPARHELAAAARRGCTTVQPASNWTCVNGNWLPPGTSSGGGTSSCTTVQPASNWTCVNGNWLPPGTSSGGGTSSCTTVQPASNWTCVNGNWLPPGTSSGGGTSSCTTVQPASNWTCVNGNWLPPGTSSGGGTSSCTTVQPASNWTCVNGNWLPPGTSSGGDVELLDRATRLGLDLRERQLATPWRVSNQRVLGHGARGGLGLPERQLAAT